jgi:hypothetical protein
MRTIREILRQKWQLGQINRTVARSVGVSVGAVSSALHRTRAAGLTTWAAVVGLTDDALTVAVYGRGRPPLSRMTGAAKNVPSARRLRPRISRVNGTHPLRSNVQSG